MKRLSLQIPIICLSLLLTSAQADRTMQNLVHLSNKHLCGFSALAYTDGGQDAARTKLLATEVAKLKAKNRMMFDGSGNLADCIATIGFISQSASMNIGGFTYTDELSVSVPALEGASTLSATNNQVPLGTLKTITLWDMTSFGASPNRTVNDAQAIQALNDLFQQLTFDWYFKPHP